MHFIFGRMLLCLLCRVGYWGKHPATCTTMTFVLVVLWWEQTEGFTWAALFPGSILNKPQQQVGSAEKKALWTCMNVRSIKPSRLKDATGLWERFALIATGFVHVSQRRLNKVKVDTTRMEQYLHHWREHEFAPTCRPLVYRCGSLCVSQTHACTFTEKKISQTTVTFKAKL